jgi:hypothetical protein
VSFASAARGSAAIADAAPAAAPSKRPRVSPTPRTEAKRYRPGRSADSGRGARPPGLLGRTLPRVTGR